MFQDGTIGDDLVVKPAPPSVRDYFQDNDNQKPFSDSKYHWTNQDIHTDRNISHWSYDLDEAEKELPVDYAFLDEDDEVDYNSVDGYNLRSMRRRRKRRDAECESCVKTGAHIVYRRRDVSDDHESDYSKSSANIAILQR